MKVINIHERIISQPKARLEELLETLSSKNDMVLATNKWSPMILDKGLQVGSKGGHGPIGYNVQKYEKGKCIKFKFTKPKGFDGFHEFKIIEIDKNITKIKHIINMNVDGFAYLKWIIAIRWLHDCYIEDAFDKVENHFTLHNKESTWSIWVKILRMILKPKKKKLTF